MTNEDRIKGHFSAIAECAGNLRRNYDPERLVENDEVVQYLRKQLDAIKKLLEPRLPADLRLTGICNQLEHENKYLQQTVAADEAYIKRLKAEVTQQKGFAALARNDRSKAIEYIRKLKKQLASFRKGWCPYNCGSADELAELRAVIDGQYKCIGLLEKELEEAKELLEEAGTLEQGLAELQKEVDKQDKYIELLKKERNFLVNEHAYRRAWNRRR